MNVRANRFPSVFSKQLAGQLMQKHTIESAVHWGNDGFCVDVACHHPHRADDVTVGVLCDMNRFEQTADPMEWEVFRTSVLEGQGWTFKRVWTPHFFRDSQAVIHKIVDEAKSTAGKSDDPDTIRAQWWH